MLIKTAKNNEHEEDLSLSSRVNFYGKSSVAMLPVSIQTGLFRMKSDISIWHCFMQGRHIFKKPSC